MRKHLRQVGATAALACAVVATVAPTAATSTDAFAGTPPAADITGIAPAVADRGATVTVTGRGFGGPNVQITVDGIAAQVLSATGSWASFVVPALAGPGEVVVRAQNPGGQAGSTRLFVRFDGHVAPVFDTGAAVTRTIGRQGGTIAAGGMTLDVPAGALPDEQAITLTPITAIAGTSLGPLVAAARMEPQGLVFLKPVRLTAPLPPGVAAKDVVGFGFEGGGVDFHLKPRGVSGSTVTVTLSHFSGAGAAAGTPSQTGPIFTYTPTVAQELAEMLIARAEADDLQTGKNPNTDPRIDSALADWFTNSVLFHLKQAEGLSEGDFEQAAAEWGAWSAEVSTEGRDADAVFKDDEATARDVTTADAADLADRLLAACSGSGVNPLEPLPPVARLAAVSESLALEVETKKGPSGRQLPEALNLPDACAHVTIASVTHPAAFAVEPSETEAPFHNTVVTDVGVDFWNGPTRQDIPIEVELNDTTNGQSPTPVGETTATGRSTLDWHPLTTGHRSFELKASLAGEDTGDAGARFDLDVRERLELRSDATLNPGGTVTLQALLAGDGMAGATIHFAAGSGSLSTPSAVTDTDGKATVDYTAPGSGSGGTDTVTATFDDVTGPTSSSVDITINGSCQPTAPPRMLLMRSAARARTDECEPTTVTVTPPTATLAPGGKTSFSATVTGVADTRVSWTATGGTIDAAGLYTAGTTPGTYTVTATSRVDPSAHDSAIVTITPPFTGVYVGTYTPFPCIGTCAQVPAQAVIQEDAGLLELHTAPLLQNVELWSLSGSASGFTGIPYACNTFSFFGPCSGAEGLVRGSVSGGVLTFTISANPAISGTDEELFSFTGARQ